MAISLNLLGLFSLRVDDKSVDLAPSAQRVLALTALLGGSADRVRLAGTLWPDRPDKRALGNLRGVLWRMPDELRAALRLRGLSVAFSSEWKIDVNDATEAARTLRRQGLETAIDGSLFSSDILPDWDSDWLIILRERHRQLRLHALEDLAAAEIADGRPLDAVDTAMQALAAEPLRESAQSLVLRAHLAAGNRAAVIEKFAHFRELLATEIGVEPSPAMQRTVLQAQGASVTRG